MAFRPLQRFGGFLDRMVPSAAGYGGLLSEADQRAAGRDARAILAAGLLQAAGPQTRPVSLGQAISSALPAAMAVRDQRVEAGLRNEQLRREIDRENKKAAALSSVRGLLGSMDPENAELIGGLFDIAPGAVTENVLNQMFAAQQAPSYESPIGKLLADRDLAARRGDTAGVQALDAAIKGEMGEDKDLGDVLRIRGDVTRNSQEFLVAQNGFQKVTAAARTDSPAGDMAMIFGFMKVLDPGSIVREGEFATVQNSGNVPTQIRALYNRILNGERLTPEQRQDFLFQAREQFVPLIERQQRLVRDAEQFAERNNLPFADIVPEFVMPTLPEPLPPPPQSNPKGEVSSLFDQLGTDVRGLFNGQGPALPPPPPGFTRDE